MRGKRIFCLLLLVALCLAGCGRKTQQTVTWLDLFDTVTMVTHDGSDPEGFDRQAGIIRQELQRYHQLFDIYKDYPGVNNLKTVNDQAGIAPVQVDRAIIDLLLDCRKFYELTDGRVDVTMGAVLQLWHEARTSGLADPKNAKLPDAAALEEAAKHRGFDKLLIDAENATVYLTDSEMRLDVGAIAKGWATQKVAEGLPAGYLLSVGGNVCVSGPKNGKMPWKVGVQHPRHSGYVRIIQVEGGCVVTSGDYQRTYMVDGRQYHHIIDPDTQMPATLWQSVTIVCDDSALADALSTALFLLPLEEGRALLEQCSAEALWIDAQGETYYSTGFEKLIQQ